MIEGQLIGDRELIQRFGTLAPKIHLRVAKALREVIIRLQSYVKSARLSGDPLHVRTGALRRSVGELVEDLTDEVIGKVGVFEGPTLVYGRAHEFGFDGTVTVKEHLRRTKYGDATVRAHERTMHIPVKRWLGGAFDQFQDAIREVLREAVAEAVRA